MNAQKSNVGASTAPKLVTIAVPVYKRLEYLPHVLKIVESQDYPAIELLISDNGMNGTKVRDIVQANYSRPFTFRQNPATVELSAHFNQLVEVASGEYFILLCDDDEISSNFVSELVQLLERHPEASVGVAKQQIIDSKGAFVRESKDTLPELLSGPDFIRGTWQKYEFNFECFATVVMKTREVKVCDGYLGFTRGTGNDNALLIKLCLNNYVVFSSNCVFRWRIDASSNGWSVPIQYLGASTREYLQFLDTDPVLRRFSATQPAVWQELRNALVRNEWVTYLWRWRDIYQSRLSAFQWVRAAFALPFIPAYYWRVASVLVESAMDRVKRLLPGHYAPQKEGTWFKG